MKKRVLYIIHRSWPYLGGAERLFWEWAKSSRNRGDEVTIFTTNAWDIESFHDKRKKKIEILKEVVEGITIRRFNIISFSPLVHFSISKTLALIPGDFFSYAFGYPHILLPGYLWKMLFTQEKYDLVNTGVFPHLFLTYPAVRYAKKMNIPLVITPLVHLGEPHSEIVSQHFLSSRHARLLRQADGIATMSNIEKEAISQQRIPEKKIHVVGAGVDPVEILGGKTERFRHKFNIRDKIVLQISTQTHDKGSHHLIEAMKYLWNKGLDATLVLIGQVMNDFDTYFLRQDPRFYEKILVLDYVDEETKKDALDACDIFVMSSRVESFGIVYLEAWLYEKPVVGAFAGAVPEIVADGKDGLLVPFADVHMLSESIQMLLTMPEIGRALGRNGRQKVLDRYTWEKSREKIQTLYDEVMPS
jgi:glycosyltransferase involved in cell wall biosynthesis